jgi:hypothetical protein
LFISPAKLPPLSPCDELQMTLERVEVVPVSDCDGEVNIFRLAPGHESVGICVEIASKGSGQHDFDPDLPRGVLELSHSRREDYELRLLGNV